jgi:hypothetical protein
VPVASLPWRSIQRIIWYGAAGRVVTDTTVGLVPVLGAFVNSFTAMVLTEFLSSWLDELMRHPNQVSPEVTMGAIKTVFTTALQKAVARSRSTESNEVTVS